MPLRKVEKISCGRGSRVEVRVGRKIRRRAERDREGETERERGGESGRQVLTRHTQPWHAINHQSHHHHHHQQPPQQIIATVLFCGLYVILIHIITIKIIFAPYTGNIEGQIAYVNASIPCYMRYMPKNDLELFLSSGLTNHV